jgi:hypothetical protein
MISSTLSHILPSSFSLTDLYRVALHGEQDLSGVMWGGFHYRTLTDTATVGHTLLDRDAKFELRHHPVSSAAVARALELFLDPAVRRHGG